jgi:hypothetical protein
MAAAHKQPSVVALLLATYPGADILRERVLEAAFENLDLETFKLLHSHAPYIVDYEFSGRTNSLIEACLTSDPCCQTAFWTTERTQAKAASRTWGLPSSQYTRRSPLEIITKMVKRGAIVTPAVVKEAIRQQRPDVLKFLLNQGRAPPPGGQCYVCETNNREMIALMEKRQGETKESTNSRGEHV